MSNDVVYGRGPNGRALRKDGTERKERRTLSIGEKIEQLKQAQIRACVGMGRAIFATVPNLAKFVDGISTFRRWISDAKSYLTEEDRQARREYFQRQIDLIDAKGEAAAKWLPGAEKAISTISGLYQNIGEAIEAFIKANNREPTHNEAEAIVSRFLSADVRKIVEDANNPENDVFYGLRREDTTVSSPEGTDTL